ncbi:molybdopterin-guanine dinucleotide biosynthesis protein MobA [Aeromicrobium sp. Leaf291]|nr:molybdopterin-guanine dinucleotide biosynthesis protein MobA [Aeromicrobium sp. Leaf291]
MGRPKALVRGDDGVPWVERAVRVLRDGGCGKVTVVLGAAAEEARALVPDDADVVVARRWDEGMSASLRAGLRAVGDSTATAVLIHLVDLPDVGPDVVRRLAATGVWTGALARASYSSRPGHPVLVGRDHWAGIVASAGGDAGAREYLRSGGAAEVECGDLAGGRDVDTASGLDA